MLILYGLKTLHIFFKSGREIFKMAQIHHIKYLENIGISKLCFYIM